MIGIDRYDHMIHFCRMKHIERNYGMNSIMNTQILIFEFEYLQSGSNILESDATRLGTVKLSYSNWIHSKNIFRTHVFFETIFRTQVVIKFVI
jgi:hypothetical protein